MQATVIHTLTRMASAQTEPAAYVAEEGCSIIASCRLTRRSHLGVVTLEGARRMDGCSTTRPACMNAIQGIHWMGPSRCATTVRRRALFALCAAEQNNR